mgnify:CR=1 FL=1
MTLEKMGYIEERIDNRVSFKRPKMFSDYYEWIGFNLTYKEIDIININSIDMMLLESIYAKAKELFE